MKTAILLSGGQDSLALTFWKRPDFAFTIDYGQKAAQAELRVSKEICRQLNIHHHIIRLICSEIFSGELFGKTPVSFAPYPDWVPFRNQLLTTIAAIKAVELGVNVLYSGQVSNDKNHSDGTPSFVNALSSLLSLQEGNILLEAPAINLTTAKLVMKSGIPKSIFSLAHSCNKSNIPCGSCRGCNKHSSVLTEIGFFNMEESLSGVGGNR